MTYVERLLGEQGQANRRLGEEILQQMSLEAMHTAARPAEAKYERLRKYLSIVLRRRGCAAFLKTGAAGLPILPQ